jgi:hypothetical protein
LRSEALQKSVNKKLLLVPLSFGEGRGEVCSREFFCFFFDGQKKKNVTKKVNIYGTIKQKHYF